MSVPTTRALSAHVDRILDACGAKITDGDQSARTPITGGSLGPVGSAGDVADAVDQAVTAFETWRETPGPVRGATVRRLGELLREHKDELGELVSIETGKIRSEGLGEVQEMIDICDFAVGLSRQLHGLTIASERPGHRLMESWHPMGPVAVITAFNFPGRGVVVERRARARVRRPGDLEAERQDAAHRARLQRLVRAGGRRDGCAGPPQPGAARRRRSRSGARRQRRGADRVGHRFDGDGAPGRAGRRRSLRPLDPRAGRQQRGDRRSVRRPRPRAARHRLLGGGHGGPAVHVVAASHRPSFDPRPARRAHRSGLRRRCRSATRSPTARSSAR